MVMDEDDGTRAILCDLMALERAGVTIATRHRQAHRSLAFLPAVVAAVLSTRRRRCHRRRRCSRRIFFCERAQPPSSLFLLRLSLDRQVRWSCLGVLFPPSPLLR